MPFWSWLCLSTVAAWGAGERPAKSEVAVPASFVRTESFAVPEGARDLSVIFGNSDIGFFLQRELTVKGNRAELTFVPPTYLKPIEFSVRYRTSGGRLATVPAGSRRYVYPASFRYASPPKAVGRLSFPFFLVNAAVANPGDKFHTGDRGNVADQPGDANFFPAIVNRLGEVVWYAAGADLLSPRSFLMEPAGAGRYLFLGRDRSSVLVLMDSRGKVHEKLNFRQLDLPPNSHSFKYLPESRELLYFSYDCRKLPWYREFAPLFSGFSGFMRLFYLPRRTYRGGRLLRLDLGSRSATEIWSSYRDFSPEEFPNLFTMSTYGPDRFLDARTPEAYEQLKREVQWFSSWGETCDADWTHENSVDYLPGEGYLVSIRNLNMLVMLDLQGKLLWRLGEDSRSEFRLPLGKGFAMQHSASFLPGGDILLFDNNAPFRGATGRRRQSRVMVIGKPVPGVEPEIKLSATLPVPQTLIRGSSSALANGSYFAYVPGNPGTREAVLEVDPLAPDRVRKLEFGGDLAIRGIEAKPLYAIGSEEMVSEAENHEPEKAPKNSLAPEQLIDTTY